MRFLERVALITAAGSGIGRTTAEIIGSEGGVVGGRRDGDRAETSSRHTICDAPVPDSVTWPAGSWTRFSSCSGTSRFRRRNATWGASRNCDVP
jgi:NAD(P)-dependent dehydrogenase (short-subunit alcohol dehydrogenase family)